MNREQFLAQFTVSLDSLKQSEQTTRRELRELSRSLLSALHGASDSLLLGDIQYVNSVLPHLSPVNKKAYRVFMQHFTGFHFDDSLQAFTKKSKKRYDDAKTECVKKLEDPNFNIWSWAERHIEVQAKPFTDDKVKDYIERAVKKMGGDQVRVLKAVFAAGITADALMVALQQDEKMAERFNVVDEEQSTGIVPEPAPL